MALITVTPPRAIFSPNLANVEGHKVCQGLPPFLRLGRLLKLGQQSLPSRLFWITGNLLDTQGCYLIEQRDKLSIPSNKVSLTVQLDYSSNICLDYVDP